MYVPVYHLKIWLLKCLVWYSCLLYISGFQKVNRSQISSEVDVEKPLLEKICKFENVNSKLQNGHRFKILTGEKQSYSEVFTI